MKSKIAITILMLILAVFIIEATLAVDDIGELETNTASNYELKTGKNTLKIEETLYVKALIELNPEIEYVSYYDEFLQKSIGYVNVLGGVGKNFIIGPGETYEISVKTDMTLILP